MEPSAMRLLKNIIENMTSAGSVAGSAMPLFVSLTKQPTISTKTIRYSTKKANKTNTSIREYFYAHVKESAMEVHGIPATDTTGIIAKLKSLEKQSSANKYDSTAFALEDDDGNIIRITVKSEQGEPFEKALQHFMSNGSSEFKQHEIAEILFKLKDNFDIIDVTWPEIEEDEEDVVGQPTDLPVDDELGDDLGVDAQPVGDEQQAQSLLVQVINMMKADAEARTAEAAARKQEAKTKETELGVSQALTKVSQEEQLLDMETQQKEEKEYQKEIDRIAKLNAWKKKVAGETTQVDTPDPTAKLNTTPTPDLKVDGIEDETTPPGQKPVISDLLSFMPGV